MSVCIESEDFTERKVKEAMARQIAMEFAFRQARQLVGKKFPLDVVMSEYKKGDVFDLW